MGRIQTMGVKHFVSLKTKHLTGWVKVDMPNLVTYLMSGVWLGAALQEYVPNKSMCLKEIGLHPENMLTNSYSTTNKTGRI